MKTIDSLSIATHEDARQGVALAVVWEIMEDKVKGAEPGAERLVAHIDACNLQNPDKVLEALRGLVARIEERPVDDGVKYPARKRFNPRPA